MTQIASCCLFLRGGSSHGRYFRRSDLPEAGEIEVTVSFDSGPCGTTLKAAGLRRTARLIARGEVMVPRAVWAGLA